MKLPAPMSLVQIAKFIDGEVQGPADMVIDTIATSPMAATESDLAFIFDKQLIKQIDKCKAKAVIVPKGTKIDRAAIFVARPTYAIYKMLSAVGSKRYLPAKGIHPSAVIDPSCQMAEDVAIGALVVIGAKTKIGARTKIMANTVIGGEVIIGEDCLIHPACMIADNVQIGNRVILQQGASLGSDGFGYVTERPSNMELRMNGVNELSEEANPLLKIPQIGTVIIEDDVEIGSNSTIDRATIGATRIGKGTKIDNLVMVAHNCHVGTEVILVSQVGIAGSCYIGDRAVIAGQVGMKDHVKIGKDAIIQGQAGVMKNIEDRGVQMGSPSFPAKEFMTVSVLSRKLPGLFDQVKAAEKKIIDLQAQIKELQNAKTPELEKVQK
jgi:UDP-3-O-[3-hydroxymyristoyl] glucosamine N-acyltransferase